MKTLFRINSVSSRYRLALLLAVWALLAGLLMGNMGLGQQPPSSLPLPEPPPGTFDLDRIRQLLGGKSTSPSPAEDQPLPPQDTSVESKARIPLAGTPPVDEIKVTGKNGLVSIIARNAALGKVLALLAQTQQFNLVATSDLTAQVSLNMQDVPLEDALTSILSVSGYTWALHNNVIHVSSISNGHNLPPNAQGRMVRVHKLDFIAASDVEAVVRSLLSPAGRVMISSSSHVDNRKTKEVLIVEDFPAYLGRIDEYLAQVDCPPRQVLIEAHILQVDLKDDLHHGVNFNYLSDVAGNTIKLELKGMASTTTPQAMLASINGSELTSLLELLKTTTDAKTLASPKVLVVNGQEARIQVGAQLGFRVTTTTETSTLQSVNFLDVGVVLRVTPRISQSGEVLMHVKPEVSSGEVNPDTGLPQEETTEVETDILLRDGQAIVIGGLIQEKDSDIQNKIPGFGDLWLLGRLFQKRDRAKDRSEIIIALLPRIVPCCQDTSCNSELLRAQTRLFHGPLQRLPRPWEPHLNDSLERPCSPAKWWPHRPTDSEYFYYPGETSPWESSRVPLEEIFPRQGEPLTRLPAIEPPSAGPARWSPVPLWQRPPAQQALRPSSSNVLRR